MTQGDPQCRRLEIELPVPLPTWNRLLAMQHFERMKYRHLMHLFVSKAVNGEAISELDILNYMALIRPSKTRRQQAKEARDANKILSKMSNNKIDKGVYKKSTGQGRIEK